MHWLVQGILLVGLAALGWALLRPSNNQKPTLSAEKRAAATIDTGALESYTKTQERPMVEAPQTQLDTSVSPIERKPSQQIQGPPIDSPDNLGSADIHGSECLPSPNNTMPDSDDDIVPDFGGRNTPDSDADTPQHIAASSVSKNAPASTPKTIQQTQSSASSTVGQSWIATLKSLPAQMQLDFQKTITADIAAQRELQRDPPHSATYSMLLGKSDFKPSALPQAAQDHPVSELLCGLIEKSSGLASDQVRQLVRETKLDAAFAKYLKTAIKQKVEFDEKFVTEMLFHPDRYPLLASLSEPDEEPPSDTLDVPTYMSDSEDDEIIKAALASLAND